MIYLNIQLIIYIKAHLFSTFYKIIIILFMTYILKNITKNAVFKILSCIHFIISNLAQKPFLTASRLSTLYFNFFLISIEMVTTCSIGIIHIHYPGIFK